MKYRNKFLPVIALVVILMVVTLAGCGSKPGDNGGADSSSSVITMAQSTDPVTLDPHRASADVGANVTRNICESLVTFNAKDELIPELAKSWEQTAENQWIFKLEEGIKFSNGEPFNAQTVVYNLDRAASKKYPRQAYDYATYYDHAESVDEYTVKIVTKTPDNVLPSHLCDMPMIAPKHSADIGEEAIGSDVIGTGPYILESWEHDQQITLKANPDYWRGAPSVEKYVIKTIPESATRIAELLSGNVDIIYDVNFEDVSMLEGQSSVRIDKKPTRRVTYIDYNTTSWTPAPELKDVRVRQAMNYAVDMPAIIDNVMGGYGVPLATIYRKDFPGYDASVKGLEYNPKKAKQLLEEAGYPGGFTIKCQVSDGMFPKAVEVAQAVSSYLEKVGIKMEVQSMEFNTMRSVVINGQEQKKAAGLFLWSWASKPTVIDSWLTGIVHSSGMTSYNAIPGYDQLVDKILATTDLKAKAPLYEEFQKKLVEDPPFLYLFQLESIYGISNRVEWSPSNTQFMLAKEMRLK